MCYIYSHPWTHSFFITMPCGSEGGIVLFHLTSEATKGEDGPGGLLPPKTLLSRAPSSQALIGLVWSPGLIAQALFSAQQLQAWLIGLRGVPHVVWMCLTFSDQGMNEQEPKNKPRPPLMEMRNQADSGQRGPPVPQASASRIAHDGLVFGWAVSSESRSCPATSYGGRYVTLDKPPRCAQWSPLHW